MFRVGTHIQHILTEYTTSTTICFNDGETRTHEPEDRPSYGNRGGLSKRRGWTFWHSLISSFGMKFKELTLAKTLAETFGFWVIPTRTLGGNCAGMGASNGAVLRGGNVLTVDSCRGLLYFCLLNGFTSTILLPRTNVLQKNKS